MSQPQPEHTLSELLQRYDQEYLCHMAPSTQRHHRCLYRRLCTRYGDLPLTDLTTAWLRQWRAEISQGRSVGTIRQYLATLSGPLRAAVEDFAWLPEHPMRQVRKPPEPPGRDRFLSAEERVRLLTACEQSLNPYLALIVQLALVTGARRNELCRLRWQDVDLERGLLRVAKTKNRQPRGLPVVGEVLERLRAYATRPPHPVWLFPRQDGRAPVLIEQAWRTARKRAGLTDFRFHDLRHTAASYLAMSGASLLDIATILGHKKLDMVQRYAHLTEPHTRGVLERMAAQFLQEPPPSPAP
jgi:integrase